MSERPHRRPASAFLTFAIAVAVLAAVFLAGTLGLMLAVGVGLIPHD